MDASKVCISQGEETRLVPNWYGTLGGGNHYAEVQVADEIMDEAAATSIGITKVGQICIMIHIGYHIKEVGTSSGHICPTKNG